jgi:hypothetical protein
MIAPARTSDPYPDSLTDHPSRIRGDMRQRSLLRTRSVLGHRPQEGTVASNVRDYEGLRSRPLPVQVLRGATHLDSRMRLVSRLYPEQFPYHLN